MYHFIKRKAIRDKVKLINSYQPVKGRILDIGAGTGDFLWNVKIKTGNSRIEPNDKAKGIAVGKGIKFGDTIES